MKQAEVVETCKVAVDWVGFSRALGHFRAFKGMTQDQVGALVGCDGSRVSRVEKGEPCGTDVYLSLCKWMGISPFLHV
jgi:hypothetical protein